MPDRDLFEQLDQAIDAILGGTSPAPVEPELAGLAAIAGGLRYMPAEHLQTNLQNELQRRASMMTTSALSVREGFRTITSYITVAEGDKLIDFLKQTFGAEEVHRQVSPRGFHAELRIGDSMLMIGSGESVRGRERIGAFHVYVPDCDAAYGRAIQAGATSMGEPADRPYGERSGFVKDAAGNHWFIATRLAPPNPPEGLGTVVPFAFPMKARPFIDFLKRAFQAQEMAVIEHSGHVMHAAVRLGDAVLEMGEPHDPLSLPSRFYLYVDDSDAWYRRALAAGATSLSEPADQPYGERIAGVQDPFGYEWFLATPLKNLSR